jgi:hypothetical protein
MGFNYTGGMSFVLSLTVDFIYTQDHMPFELCGFCYCPSCSPSANVGSQVAYCIGLKAKCNGGYSGSSNVLGAIIWRRQGCRRNGRAIGSIDPVVGAECDQLHTEYTYTDKMAAPVRYNLAHATGD